MDRGRALDSTEREMKEEVKTRFSGAEAQQFVLLSCGDDPVIEPGDLAARRHSDQAW